MKRLVELLTILSLGCFALGFWDEPLTAGHIYLASIALIIAIAD